jgi:ABC-2 type transport system permease protein
VWAIATREFVSMFRVPAGWIIIALFAFLSGVLFVNQILIPGAPGSMRYFFGPCAWMLVAIAPAISMRLLSEEYRTGSFESLRTTPAGDWAVAVGKYVGAVLFLVSMLVPSLALPVILAFVSDPMPDPGPIVSGYLMLVLVGMVYLGIGLLASSLTSSQTLAFLGTLMTLVLLMVVTGVLAPRAGGRLGELLSAVSVIGRAGELGKGIIDTATIAFFLIASVWMLALTSGVLEVRRLARPKRVVGAMYGVFAAATLGAALFAGILTHEHRARVDVTSTSAHRLSDRAQRMVDRLSGETRLVLAVDRSGVDRRTLDLVEDVLDAYGRASDLVDPVMIDLGAGDAPARIGALLGELRAREADAIGTNIATLEDAAARIAESAVELESVAPVLASARDTIDAGSAGAANNRAFFEQRASLLRLSAQDLNASAGSIREGLGGEDPRTVSIAEGPMGVLGSALRSIGDLDGQLASVVSSDQFAAATRAVARDVRGRIGTIADELSVVRDALGRLDVIDAERVATALETGEALMVIGEPAQGVAAVDLTTLLPSAQTLESLGLSASGVIGPRAQELIASAIGELVVEEHPIVVFVHAGRQGDLLGASALLSKTVEALGSRGIDSLEWSAIELAEAPGRGDVDPLLSRPVVYFVYSTDSAAGSGETGVSGTRRAEALGRVTRQLIEAGESVLVCVNPSIFHTFGDTDPVVRALEPLGIVPDPTRTIMRAATGPAGTRADPTSVVVGSARDATHPIEDAIRGLRGVYPWAVPIAIDERLGVEQHAILTLREGGAWAERDWQDLWTTDAPSRPYMRDQPVFDAARDEKRESWTIGASAERERLGVTQRVIVIGSNSWASDATIMAPEQLVDGRITRPYPGNQMLFEGSISWLAGLDDLIAPGASARAVATIRALDGSTLSVLRWVLLGVIPGLIIVAGVVVRVVLG